MNSRVFALALIGAACVGLCSCEGERKPQGLVQVPVFPVKGEVFLNGAPADGVKVKLHPKASVEQGLDPAADPGVLYGNVGKDGKVDFTTYERGDGVPAGDYKVTFEWTPKIKSTRADPVLAPDKLGGKYSDPAASEIGLAVGEGAKNDLGKVELEAEIVEPEPGGKG